MSDIPQRVKDIVAGESAMANIEITSEYSLSRDLYMDELDQIEMTMRIEEEFGIEISDEDADELRNKTVGEVIAYVEKAVAKKNMPGA